MLASSSKNPENDHNLSKLPWPTESRQTDLLDFRPEIIVIAVIDSTGPVFAQFPEGRNGLYWEGGGIGGRIGWGVFRLERKIRGWHPGYIPASVSVTGG